MPAVLHRADIDERTARYFDAVEDRLGLVDMKVSERWTITMALDKEAVPWAKVGTLDIGSAIGQGTVEAEIIAYESPNSGKMAYCATWGVRFDIDAVAYEMWTFTEKPTQDALDTARALGDLLSDIRRGRFTTRFNCRECGRGTHWLDSEPPGEPKDLESRRDRAEDKWCGC